MARTLEQLRSTLRSGESSALRVEALRELMKRRAASRDLLRSLCEDPDPAVVDAAAGALVDVAETEEQLLLFDELSGRGRARAAIGLLRDAPELGVQRVLARYFEKRRDAEALRVAEAVEAGLAHD